jgi:putative intracellular protease/amidase
MAERKLAGKKVAILAADMFERVELEKPRQALEDAGATTQVISIHDGEIKGFDHFDPATTVKVDRTVEEVSVDDYDALLVPGGVGNPDQLRGTRMPSTSSVSSSRRRSPWRSSATARGCSSRRASCAGGS